mmetsp:Transcript_9055/g.28485  ORF Transcript_9055/g.28485 Transcript_9055/m.28485 type:complete len:135 (-) Transcript_9055:4-408(-)
MDAKAPPVDLGWSAAATALLCGSSVAMITAWYLHLKFESWSVPVAIFLSWLIAGAEYCLQVPANRIGAARAHLSPAQLRAIAEAATLISFLVFQRYVLNVHTLWNHIVGFAMVFAGVCFVLFGPLNTPVFPQGA